MKTFHIVFLFHFIYFLKTGNSDVNITLSSSSHKLPVKLNEKVVINCKLSKIDPNQPVLILRNGDIESENCKIYRKDRYVINCKNNTEFNFEIRKMSWEDKGKWDCMYSSYSKSINLDIYVSNNVSISINPSLVQILSSNLGFESFPMKHENSAILKGRGTKLNPYDLRKNVTVNLMCESDCGYPEVYHTFNFKNSSNFSLELNKTSFTFKTYVCETKRYTSSAVSLLKLNCWNFKLYGLINLTCSTFHSFEKNLKLKMSEKIFILCPTDPIKWWKMTYPEMINTVIGSMIGFMLLMFLCLMLCRWKSYKHKNNYDSCQEDIGDSKMGRGYRV